MNMATKVMASQQQSPPVEEGFDSQRLFSILRSSKRYIVGFTVCFFLIGLGYLLVADPVYRTSTLLQVNTTPEAPEKGDSLATLFNTKNVTETEIEILHSRSVMRTVVNKLHLDISAVPVRVPVIGKLLHQSELKHLPFFNHYAAADEQVKLQQFDVPKGYVDRPFRIVAGAGQQFLLFTPNGQLLLKGEAGPQAITVNGPSGQQRFVIQISSISAHPGSEFLLTKHNTERVINDLLEEYRVVEQGKQTGVISATLDGTDPRKITDSLNLLTAEYIKLNIARRSEDAEKKLLFVEGQLPMLKANLTKAEDALSRFQASGGKVDVPEETKSTIGEISDVEKQILTNNLQIADLREKFTDQHPVMQALEQKDKELRGKLEQLKERNKTYPAAEQKTISLQRDVKVANDLYLALLGKAQEFRLARAGTASSVHVVDMAHMPIAPVKPQKGLILTLFILAGLVCGVLVAFVRSMKAEPKLENASWLENNFDIPVLANIPHSGLQAAMSYGRTAMKTPDVSDKVPVLAFAENDMTLENLRMLRTHMQAQIRSTGGNTVAIISPGPGCGKSFIALNLAYLSAATEKNILLVDSDLRRGRLNEYFGSQLAPGLVDVLQGDVPLSEAIQQTHTPHLSFLAAGQYPKNPSELLMSRAFRQFVNTVAAQFDLVIFDTSPLLLATDAEIISSTVHLAFLVTRAGMTGHREITSVLKQLQLAGVIPDGIIFNGGSRANTPPYMAPY